MDQNTNTGAQTQEKESAGPTVSIIVIVLVLAFGAYYFFKQVPVSTREKGVTGAIMTPATTTDTGVDMTTSTLSVQGTSTEIVDIQKDINASNFSNLGAGLSDITI